MFPTSYTHFDVIFIKSNFMGGAFKELSSIAFNYACTGHITCFAYVCNYYYLVILWYQLQFTGMRLSYLILTGNKWAFTCTIALEWRTVRMYEISGNFFFQKNSHTWICQSFLSPPFFSLNLVQSLVTTAAVLNGFKF